jgi:meso-butanediol dehydrogenase / (S,S)-butanediol dehydrogenase / diacetyl reductase
LQRLKDRVAVVTGAGTGIGKATAVAFAAEGAKVVLVGRTLSRLEEAAAEIKAKQGIAKAVACDVSDEKQVIKLMADTVSDYGQIDVLINNHAGGRGGGPIANMDLAGWNETVAIDLTGTMLCCREALKNMIPRKTGNIVNISSIAGVLGAPFLGPYPASKAGIIGMTMTLSMEVGQYNIRVNSISPAATRTDRFENPQKAAAKAKGISLEEHMKEILARYSLNRIAEPSEVAAVILFLACDESSAITGQNLIVSCGYHSLHP